MGALALVRQAVWMLHTQSRPQALFPNMPQRPCERSGQKQRCERVNKITHTFLSVELLRPTPGPSSRILFSQLFSTPLVDGGCEIRAPEAQRIKALLHTSGSSQPARKCQVCLEDHLLICSQFLTPIHSLRSSRAARLARRPRPVDGRPGGWGRRYRRSPCGKFCSGPHVDTHPRMKNLPFHTACSLVKSPA
eukprot:scaffold46445_cov59-Phaeocystis_antarctica.AAC.2